MIFVLGNKANLSLVNMDEGSTIRISIDSNYHFLSGVPPLSYTAIMEYLEKDPPTEELDSYLRKTIRSG